MHLHITQHASVQANDKVGGYFTGIIPGTTGFRLTNANDSGLSMKISLPQIGNGPKLRSWEHSVINAHIKNTTHCNKL